MVRTTKPSVPISVPKTPLVLGTLKRHMSVRKNLTSGKSSKPQPATPKKPVSDRSTSKVPSPKNKRVVSIHERSPNESTVPSDTTLLAQRRKEQEWQKKERARQDNAVERRAKKIANGFLYKGKWIESVVKKPFTVKVEDGSEGCQEYPLVIEEEETTVHRRHPSPMVVIRKKRRDCHARRQELEEHENHVPALADAITPKAIPNLILPREKTVRRSSGTHTNTGIHPTTSSQNIGPYVNTRPLKSWLSESTKQTPSRTLTFFRNTHNDVHKQNIGTEVNASPFKGPFPESYPPIPSATLSFFGDTHQTMRKENTDLTINAMQPKDLLPDRYPKIPSATLTFFKNTNSDAHQAIRNRDFGPDITTSFDRQYPQIAEMVENQMMDEQDDAGSLCDFVVEDADEYDDDDDDDDVLNGYI